VQEASNKVNVLENMYYSFCPGPGGNYDTYLSKEYIPENCKRRYSRGIAKLNLNEPAQLLVVSLAALHADLPWMPDWLPAHGISIFTYTAG
jgi:hypothetical protein